MAIFRTWDAFDLRLVNFRQIYDNAGRIERLDGPQLEDVSYRWAVNYLTPAMGDYLATVITFFGQDLRLGNDGFMTGGTVQAIYRFFENPLDNEIYFNLSIRGLSLPAADIAQAMRTVGRADDDALLTRMLAQNDTIIMSDFNDYMEGRGGNDTIDGGSGSDTLLGGVGADRIIGGAGRDVLTGGAGRDRLISTADRATDVFVFNMTSGADTIQGFEDGRDRIQISGISSLTQVTVRDAGADALIRFGSNEVTVKNIDHNLITASDFLLA